jgi:DNA-binding IclR family transcriptional regulator
MSQTVDRALSIVELLGDGDRSLADVAAELGVHKSTALRLLQTLEARGFVRHDDQHRYRLGSQLFRLASVSLGALDIRSVAAPRLRRLSDLTQQTAHLGCFDGVEVFYLDKHEASAAVRMYSRIGAAAPLYCTGVAKAILAEQPLSVQRSLASNIEYVRHTDYTITSPAEFLRELELTRERGYAVDNREHELYIHCVAAPIKLDDQPVTHAVSVSATTIGLAWEKLLEFVPLLHETAAAIRDDII